MSFNSLIKNNHKIDYNIKKEFIDNQIKKQRFNFVSYEEFLSFQSDSLDYDSYLENLQNNLKSASQFEQLDLDNLNKQKEYYDLILKEINLRTIDIVNTYENYSQQIDFKKLSLKSKINELQQKLSSLSSFDGEKKFSFKENFFNLYNIHLRRNDEDNLDVDSESNVSTLPIKESKNVGIKNIFVSNKSNGVPGNYNTGKNKFIFNIINENDNLGFEYFKVGKGPLLLNLILELGSEEIVNEIQISKNINFINTNFKIKNIVFNSKTNGNVNLKSLIDESKQELSFNNAFGKENINIKHLPTFVNRVSIELETNEFEIIDDVKVFCMYINTIKLFKHRYLNEGSLYSKDITLPKDLGIFFANLNIYPKNKSYIINMDVSNDKGGSYESLVFNKDFISNYLFLSNDIKDLMYKLSLKKDNNIFKQLNTYSNEEYFLETDSTIKTFSKKISPIEYNFPTKLVDDSLKIFQTSLAKRSLEDEKYLILKTIENNGFNYISLPFSLNKLKILKSDLSIKVNDEIWEQVQSIEELDIEENVLNKKYFIENDGKRIVINNNLSIKLEIKYSLKPLMPSMMLKPEGYYVKIDETFDYNKRNINIYSILNNNEEVTEILPEGNINYFLKNNYINSNNFKLYKYVNESWIEEENYKLDNITGILNVDSVSKLKVVYSYFKVNYLEDDDFEIWVKDNEVKGIYIKPEKISLSNVTEPINNNNVNYYLFDGTFLLNKKNVSLDSLNNTFVLSHSNIIKGSVSFEQNLFDNTLDYIEVSYINGFSEFLGLEEISKDFIPKIETDDRNEISFSLKEIPYLNDGFEIEIYDQNGSIVSNATSRSNDRVLTINFNGTNINVNTVVEDYYLKYFFQNKKNLRGQKYSIDYKEGILYTSKNLTNTNIDINYSVGQIGIEYDLLEEVKDYSFINNNRTISLYTENLKDYSNTIKIIWLKNKSNLSFNNLEEYFSPIVYSVELGMK